MRTTRHSSLGNTRNPSLRTAGAVLAVAALTALGNTALADDLLVPSQYPTIQAALDAVTAGDTVVLAPGVYSGAGNEALQMPSVAFTLRGETGDPADAVIEGPSDPYIRVVHAMDFGAGASGTRLEDLTVTEFSGVNGGAIRVNGADLWFDNCVFSGNTTGNMGCFSSGYGGAFYTTGGELQFTDCVIRNNSAYDEVCSGHGGRGTGGGIYARGTGLVFERCLIENNRAGGYSGGDGAAIGASSSTVTLIDSTVRGNILGGTGSGGGVAASRVISINTDFINNRASGLESTGQGGAISADNVTVIGGSFVGNIAGSDSYGSSGGAISGRIVDITNAVFTENRLASYPGEPMRGAALYVRDGGTLTNVTFAGNTGAVDGEAVYAFQGALDLRNCIVDNGDWAAIPRPSPPRGRASSAATRARATSTPTRCSTPSTGPWPARRRSTRATRCCCPPTRSTSTATPTSASRFPSTPPAWPGRSTTRPRPTRASARRWSTWAHSRRRACARPTSTATAR